MLSLLGSACTTCNASLACVAGVARFYFFYDELDSVTVYIGDYPVERNVLVRFRGKEKVKQCARAEAEWLEKDIQRATLATPD